MAEKADKERVDTDKIVMIGDQLYTDIIFGNNNKMATIKVEPFSRGREVGYDKWYRVFEDNVLLKQLPEVRQPFSSIERKDIDI